MTNTPFTPGASVPLAATAASGNVTLGKPIAPTASARQCRVANSGPNKAFIKFGSGALAAAVTDMMIPANWVQIFTVDDGVTVAAAICAATETANLCFTMGYGD